MRHAGEANYSWWDGKVAERSMNISTEESLAGQTLISIETCDDEEDADIISYLTENFDKFLTYLRFIPSGLQDMTISYLVCNKIQRQLADIFETTQTQCSYYTRLTVKAMCAYMYWDGEPTTAQLAHELVAAGKEKQLLLKTDMKEKVECNLSELAVQYVHTHNFAVIANHYGIHRPELKRMFRRVAAELQVSPDPHHKMAGAWLEMVIYKSSPVAGKGGYRYRQVRKVREKELQRTDPACVGEFRIKLDDYEKVKAPTRKE